MVLVVDACGAGALPDAADYGDEGANTLVHLAEAVGGLELPVMGDLGLGSILDLRGSCPAADPAIHGRLAPAGPRQGLDHRPLGADGRDASSARCRPTPEGFPRGSWSAWRQRWAGS